MLVDDSATIRGITRRWLIAEPDIDVVASCANGLHALRKIPQAHPDVVVLDIEMPEMDGLTALPEILKVAPYTEVIMSSTLTRRNADISIKALTLGAADYIAKPESSSGLSSAVDFRRSLVEKVRALGRAAREKQRRPLPGTARSLRRPSAPGGLGRVVPASSYTGRSDGNLKLRPASKVRPQILAIGSSTGGPQALLKVLSSLDPAKTPPIVVSQHMPKTFTGILAEHLSKATPFACEEGREGLVLQPKHIYVAPGDYHMEVVASGAVKKLKLTQAPPENFCRPSVNPMFRSVAAAYGPAVLALMLTGMGQDGLEGARAVCEAGGTLIAQDKETSVVWGMPGAVAQAGLCSKVIPLSSIAGEVQHYLQGQK